MKLHEYASRDAVALAALVETGEVQPDDLKRCALTALESINPRLNAVIEALPDSEPRAGTDREPMHGLPYLTKDLPFEQGLRAEMGSMLAQDYVCAENSEVTERLLARGAVNLGRTTTSEFALAAVTENRINGKTTNPWDPQRSSAGSSGGSAAAVAAGAVPFALASDGGGSIRMPASFCGLVGLKPSRGRVTCAPDATLGYSGLVVPFVLTRTVRDTAWLLDVLEGPAEGDDVVIERPIGSYRDAVSTPGRSLKIGIATEPWSGIGVDPEVADATEQAARLCDELGHHVERDAPRIDFERYIEAQKIIWCAHVQADISALGREIGRTPGPDNLQTSTNAVYERGLGLSSEAFIDALNVYHEVTRAVAAWFRAYDVLLTPTCTIKPAPLGTYDPDQAGMTVDRFFEEQLAPHESFTSLFNCTGQPAVSVPLGMSSDGLPIGVQLAARFADEASALRLAAELENAGSQMIGRPVIHAANSDG